MGWMVNEQIRGFDYYTAGVDDGRAAASLPSKALLEKDDQANGQRVQQKDCDPNPRAKCVRGHTEKSHEQDQQQRDKCLRSVSPR